MKKISAVVALIVACSVVVAAQGFVGAGVTSATIKAAGERQLYAGGYVEGALTVYEWSSGVSVTAYGVAYVEARGARPGVRAELRLNAKPGVFRPFIGAGFTSIKLPKLPTAYNPVITGGAWFGPFSPRVSYLAEGSNNNTGFRFGADFFQPVAKHFAIRATWDRTKLRGNAPTDVASAGFAILF